MNSSTPTPNRYDPAALLHFATTLLNAAGLASERSRVVASTLLEADLMGHSTHGLALLPAYIKELENGGMRKNGAPTVLSDQGAAITWDGDYLPGPWLMHTALDLALERAAAHPVVTLVIQKSHHIACLAAYLERATQKGLMMLLSCSDPMNKTVAPFAGLQGVYSPNPIAVGIPTNGDPILFDISTSATANGIVHQKYQAGQRLPHPWLQDNNGRATDDPAAFFDNPPATILPLGGQDTGYKGFALGLLVEALTGGLSGHGRSENPTQWGASVFLQIINPAAFGGSTYFQREMSHLAQACQSAQPLPGGEAVRLPGARALALKKEQQENGVELALSVTQALQECAAKYKASMPGSL